MEGVRLSDFIKVRKLGEGGFGAAFLVRRKSDGKEFCMKEIPLPSDRMYVLFSLFHLFMFDICYCCLLRDIIQKSINEAAFLQKLRHPNLVRGYGSFIEGSVEYILMEFEPHGSLKAVIDV